MDNGSVNGKEINISAWQRPHPLSKQATLSTDYVQRTFNAHHSGAHDVLKLCILLIYHPLIPGTPIAKVLKESSASHNLLLNSQLGFRFTQVNVWSESRRPLRGYTAGQSPGDSSTFGCRAAPVFLCQPEVNHEDIAAPPLTFSVAGAAGQLSSFAAVKKEFNICWTIYAGWMPWGTISNEKIIDKWASKYGIKINIVQLNDYIESINQYTAGQFDGCTMTNMDALTIPAAGGVDTTALITGSYSEGNDGVVLKGVNKNSAI